VVIVAIAGWAGLSMKGSPLALEMAVAVRQDVREYIAEDAKTQLGQEYIVDMPFAGTIDRINLEEGAAITLDQVVACVDTFDLDQRIKGIEALIRQAEAQVLGVDKAKPKQEALDSAALRIREMENSEAIARKERVIAKIALDDAQREFERAKSLLADGALSQSEYDAAERQFQSAEQTVQRARLAQEVARSALAIAQKNAEGLTQSIDDNEYMRVFYQAEKERLQTQLNNYHEDLRKACIQSPIAGVVLEKYIEDRRVLPAGTALLKLGNLDSIEIECDVLSEEVGRIGVGNRVEITGKALAGDLELGVVSRIYPSGFQKISSLGIEQQRVRVVIDFENGQHTLRPGTSVDVRIVTAERTGALAVPERATFRQEDQWHVFVVEGGQARLRTVDVGLRNDDWVEILGGLEEGERIVAEPTNNLTDGTRVTSL
jgi:HlyD family secretion protein